MEAKSAIKLKMFAATSGSTPSPNSFALLCPSPWSCRHSPNMHRAQPIRPIMETAMLTLLRSALLVVAGLTGQMFLIAAGSGEKLKLEGQYAIIAVDKDGRQLDEANFAHFKGATVRITNEKFVAINREGNEFLNATYTIDSDKTPCTIAMKPADGMFKGKELQGLVERKDKTIHIILALPGGEQPTEFKTKENQVMYTLRAEK